MSVNGPSPKPTTWTIREAKARLSEVLRCARDDGPQRIGVHDPFIVVAEADWRALTSPIPAMGPWLLKSMPKGDDLDLPSRTDRRRPNPFED